ncbi:hypothetical protein EGW08_000337 [Elysia chlorotica]|uniref:Uncharacterized protein n=1 Tax=Elysia chlorotica TaxID=188477 RepID=A0A3S1BUL0_ELYCH|nr:hypothetical protein EGW08_000337 [Elysia chlorotica]
MLSARLALCLSVHLSGIRWIRQGFERAGASDCPDAGHSARLRLCEHPQCPGRLLLPPHQGWSAGQEGRSQNSQRGLDVAHFLSRPKIWLDSLDLHVYGLGLWAGTMPFVGTHLTCNKKVITLACGAVLGLYCVMPHLLLVTLAPYIDSMYDGGILGSEVGVKPGMAYLFVSVPHTFSKYNLSHFMAFLLYLTFIVVNLQHLSLHVLMIWENASAAIPRAVVAFFRRPPLMSAIFILISFLLTLPYLSQCGIYLYQIIRFYVDRLIFSLIIFSMVPCVIGFIRQESMRTPIDRIFMGVWYGGASVMAACFLIYNFVVYVYPEAVVAYEQRWAENLGWCVSIAPLVLGVTLGGLHTLFSLKGSLAQRLLNSWKTGSLSSGEGTFPGDGPSGDTGDTDLKYPPLGHRNLSLLAGHEAASPVSHARAPLLQAQASPASDLSKYAREPASRRLGRESGNQGPKVHRKKMKSAEPDMSKGGNHATPSKRHSQDVSLRKKRIEVVPGRKRKSTAGAIGRENSGFGEDEKTSSGHGIVSQDRQLSYQGDCCSSGACGCNSEGATGVYNPDTWNSTDIDGDGNGRGSVPIGYGTLHTTGTPKASVEVILKSASDGNMVRL